MDLIIVESPQKTKTIEKFIKETKIDGAVSEAEVVATKGHIKQVLSSPKAVIEDESFINIQWEVINKPFIDYIKKNYHRFENIYIATDMDREGEMIAWHIAHSIFEEKGSIPILFRVVFNAITKEAIGEGIRNAIVINQDREYPNNSYNPIVQAGLCRITIDHSFGFVMSSLLFKKFFQPFAAGRVKNPTLGIVFHREKEIRDFIPEKYVDMNLIVKDCEQTLNFNISMLEGKEINTLGLTIEETKIVKKQIEKSLQINEIILADVEIKNLNSSSSFPFITSSLQQAAYSTLGFSLSRTMQIAKKLYEGVEYDDTKIGLITYIRTDSTYIEKKTQSEIENYIGKYFGTQYVRTSANKIKITKHAQNAHEAIRPTNIHITPSMLNHLSPEELKLYTLIWNRTVAYFMSDCIREKTKWIFTTANNNMECFYGSSKITFLGYKILYPSKEEEDYAPTNWTKNKTLKNIQLNVQEKVTTPPNHLSEAGIVKRMEESGIGRPSTYANMVDSLFSYTLCMKKNNSIHILPKGVFLHLFFYYFFPEYSVATFTAQMESTLDKIVEKNTDWQKIVLDFYSNIKHSTKIVENIEVSKIIDKIEKSFLHFMKIEKTPCPLCKSELKLILYKNIFLSCSRYPECNFNKSIESYSQENTKITDENIKLKHGIYGWYLERKNGAEVQRASIPNYVNISELNNENAEILFSFPINMGEYKNRTLSLNKTTNALYFLWGEEKVKIIDNKLWNMCSLEDTINIIDKYELYTNGQQQKKTVPKKNFGKKTSFRDTKRKTKIS